MHGRSPGHAWPIRRVVLARALNGGHLRATRLFVRRARSGLYFNRVPSLPATDDGSARPLAEDLGNGSGGSEDITWDVDTEPGTADAAVAAGAAGADGGAGAPSQASETDAASTANAEPRVGESGRWFRPARPKTGLLAFPAEEPPDG